MQDYLVRGSVFEHLMQECFQLNRNLVNVTRHLTDDLGVTGAQWGVLGALGQDNAPRTIAEAARRMGLARQSVQRVADALAAQGLVEYLPNSADRRTKLAEVTAAGRTLLAKLEKRQLKWAKRTAGDLSEANIEEAMRLVKQIRERISIDRDANDG
ncbi:MAG: MarR family transcriptional regulator [Gammaproteobacteria bacterium]|nr:MarR family transcriptional regulator [Gammaproteobacteria bacterium]